MLEELCGDFSVNAETCVQDFILSDAVTLKLRVTGKGVLSDGV